MKDSDKVWWGVRYGDKVWGGGGEVSVLSEGTIGHQEIILET